ncbi:rCG57122 [Rattus norvegicus]|uniref:RCG57122 n=1 Tax=Rattus norvegicus TaxID=10116 RepID=A6JD98_RAT|nr:rCG57122 [Rattus norvegicus]
MHKGKAFMCISPLPKEMFSVIKGVKLNLVFFSLCKLN